MVRWRRKQSLSSAIEAGWGGSSTLDLSSDVEDEERVLGLMYLRSVGEVTKEGYLGSSRHLSVMCPLKAAS